MDELRELERRVSTGDDDAMVELGSLLLSGGDSVAKNTPRAVHLFERAVKHGNIVAMFNLASILENGGADVAKDAVRAKYLYERAAESGDGDAMNSLAVLLMKGAEGVSKDPMRAKQLYECAVEHRNDNAMINLADLLKLGYEGISKDVMRAKQLYERALTAGNISAAVRLGEILLFGDDGVPKDAVQGRQLLERAVESGDPEGMAQLGICLRYGSDGLPRDVIRAKHLLEQAGARGSVNAMMFLAYFLFVDPDRTDKDVVRAKVLCERAVEDGNLDAMSILATILREGSEGIEKDAVGAKKLYERAVESGNLCAMVGLASLLETGCDGVTKDVAQAKELYERAAEGDDFSAIYRLAVLLEEGGAGVAQDARRAKLLHERALQCEDSFELAEIGRNLLHGTNFFTKNPAHAMQFLERAAIAGNIDAMLNLAELLERGDNGVPKDVTRAFGLYKGVAIGKPAESRGSHSALEAAFAAALTDPNVLSETFLVENIIASNVNSAADLLWGHNLILLSIRAGIITRHNIAKLGGSTWYLQNNLYYPACELTGEDGSVIDAVFEHAENLGIIKSGYALSIGRKVRVDMQRDLGGINRAIKALSERVEALEGNVGELHFSLVKLSIHDQKLQKAILALANSLTQLKESLQKENRQMQYAQIARCMLSLIPLIGTAIGDTTYTAASILMGLNMKDLMGIGVDVAKAVVTDMASVDLSNFQVARYAFSNEVLSTLDAPVRHAVVTSVCGSAFESIEVLQVMLQQRIKAISQQDVSMAMLDIGSSSWMVGNTNGEPSEVPSNESRNALEEKARLYFDALVHDTGSGRLGLPEAAEAVNDLLKNCKELFPVSCDQLESIFFELAAEDEDDVSADVFVRMFQKVRIAQEQSGKTDRMMKEAVERFQSRLHNGTALSIQYAARLMCVLYSKMEKNGCVESGTSLQHEEAVQALRKVNNGNNRIEENEFMAAVREVLNRQ